MGEVENKFVHLTNFSINKQSEKFFVDDTKDNVGNKWTQTALKNELKNMGHDVDILTIKIDDIIIKSVLSIEDILYKASYTNVPYRNNCFCLLGYDIMLDSKQDPWLLEVNLCPSLSCETSVDLRVKSNLTADLMTLVGILPTDQRDLDETKINKNLFNNLNPYAVHMNVREFEAGKKSRNVELAVINETREEINRSNKFRIIFPSYNVPLYKPYLTIDRPQNAILRNEIMRNLAKPKGPVSNV